MCMNIITPQKVHATEKKQSILVPFFLQFGIMSA